MVTTRDAWIVFEGALDRRGERPRGRSNDSMLLDAMPDGLLLVNRRNVVVRSNRVADEWAGTELTGRRLTELSDRWSAAPGQVSLASLVEQVIEAGRGQTTRILCRLGAQNTRLLLAEAEPVEPAASDIGPVLLRLRELGADSDQALRTLRDERQRSFAALGGVLLHRLTNPLAALSMQLELLQRGAGPASAEVVETMARQVQEMVQTMAGVRQALQGHRVGQGRTGIAAVVADAVGQLSHRAATQGVRISLTLDEPLPTLTLAPESLVAVLGHLLENALQAMPAGGDLRVQAAVGERGACLLEVQDTGPGIAPELQQALADGLPISRADGAGLGLTISREILRAAGARLTVSSTPGSGCSAQILFPSGLCRAPAPIQPAPCAAAWRRDAGALA